MGKRRFHDACMLINQYGQVSCFIKFDLVTDEQSFRLIFLIRSACHLNLPRERETGVRDWRLRQYRKDLPPCYEVIQKCVSRKLFISCRWCNLTKLLEICRKRKIERKWSRGALRMGGRYGVDIGGTEIKCRRNGSQSVIDKGESKTITIGRQNGIGPIVGHGKQRAALRPHGEGRSPLSLMTC